ncbi:hypothetical protein AVEN_64189-1 [Araneus ventricosus]|uniref:Uncharacterized protein n=1 Tax=Araneus ventricosus TaxID=182803 RepID=A0A4Y2QJN1_ARAVE|nr:hypothetical protein AVEN_64189-1 [Araneus ventricosus]
MRRYSTSLKMPTVLTKNRQQRKFKPIGCDFDGDVVRLPRYRNPVWTVISMRHVLQTFLLSGIVLTLKMTARDSSMCDSSFSVAAPRQWTSTLYTLSFAYLQEVE